MSRGTGLRRAIGIAAAVCAAGLCCSLPTARADVFLLVGGGQVRGTWLNRGVREPDVYQIETEQGGRLSLARERVRERIAERPEEREYLRIAPGYGDTIAQQWALAEWCRKQELQKQREVHLRRIIELDPDHGPARRGLGYSHIGGRWVTRDGWQEEKGLKYYDGRYRTPQEVAVLKRRQAREEAERKWLARLIQLRQELAGDAYGKPRDELLAIRDPNAVPGLLALIGKDANPRAKLLYLQAIGNVGGLAGAEALVKVSLNDPDQDVFDESLRQLAALKPPNIDKPYLDALLDKDNLRVNRAAAALARLERKSAIGPLIEALFTTHTVVVKAPPQTAGPGSAVSSSFGSPLGGAFGSSGSPTALATSNQTKAVPVVAQNSGVLAALVKLSGGVTFGFNQQAWRNWHEQQSRAEPAPTLEARGD